MQALLKARHPTVTPSAVISGPTMLTGLIHCAKCGGAMTIRTGKGGRYRYYACSTKARQGPTGCEGMAVPMEKLDDLVASHLEDRLLQPERLETILATVLDRRQERSERQPRAHRRTEQRAAESKPASSASTTPLRRASPTCTTRRSRTGSTASRPSAIRRRPTPSAPRPCFKTPAARPLRRKWCATSPTARQHIRLEGGGYRRDHLRALAQRVEVAEGEIRIMGSKSRLLQTLVANGGVNVVPTQGLKWRRERDSNPRRAFDPYTLSRAARVSNALYAHLRFRQICSVFAHACPPPSRVDFSYHFVRSCAAWQICLGNALALLCGPGATLTGNGSPPALLGISARSRYVARTVPRARQEAAISAARGGARI